MEIGNSEEEEKGAKLAQFQRLEKIRTACMAA